MCPGSSFSELERSKLLFNEVCTSSKETVESEKVSGGMGKKTVAGGSIRTAWKYGGTASSVCTRIWVNIFQLEIDPAFRLLQNKLNTNVIVAFCTFIFNFK